MERGQVLEEDLVAGALRGIVVDGVNLQEGEIALGLALRGTDLSLDGVAGLQVELSDLGRGHVDVVRAREVEAVSATEEAVAVRQDLEDAVAEDVLAVPRMDLED